MNVCLQISFLHLDPTDLINCYILILKSATAFQESHCKMFMEAMYHMGDVTHSSLH